MSGGSTTLRNAAFAVAAVCLSLALGLAVAELSLRVYHLQKYGIGLLNDANHGLITSDARLGWKMSPDLRYRITARDALDRACEISVATDARGFRTFGDTSSNKAKLLVIGDSFTAAVEVSNDKTYHGLIKELARDVEVFAYGAGGYGSLQEFMILDEYVDLIKPDLIVWQFHENDFLDNDPELDILRFAYNSGTPRPYLGPGGDITHRYATYGNLFWVLPRVVSDNLRLLKILNNRLSLALNRRSGTGLPPAAETAWPEAARKAFARSEATTGAIMRMVGERAGKTPVYLFSVTDRQPYSAAIRRICQSAGIRFIEGVPQALAQAESEERLGTKAADREHLNEKGNRIVAERLLRFLIDAGITRSPGVPARP